MVDESNSSNSERTIAADLRQQRPTLMATVHSYHLQTSSHVNQRCNLRPPNVSRTATDDTITDLMKIRPGFDCVNCG
jgi:hypothetical protein